MTPRSLKLTRSWWSGRARLVGVDVGLCRHGHDCFKIAPEVRWARFDITPFCSGTSTLASTCSQTLVGPGSGRKVTGPGLRVLAVTIRPTTSASCTSSSPTTPFTSSTLTVTGNYQTKTRLSCPKGWSGYIQLTSKLTRSSYEDFGGGSWTSVERTQRGAHLDGCEHQRLLRRRAAQYRLDRSTGRVR